MRKVILVPALLCGMAVIAGAQTKITGKLTCAKPSVNETAGEGAQMIMFQRANCTWTTPFMIDGSKPGRTVDTSRGWSLVQWRVGSLFSCHVASCCRVNREVTPPVRGGARSHPLEEPIMLRRVSACALVVVSLFTLFAAVSPASVLRLSYPNSFCGQCLRLS